MLVLLSTISSFLDNDISFGVFSLVVFLLGCIYYFLFPSILAKTAYQRFSNQNNGESVYVKVSVDTKNIVVENKELKSKDTYSLDSIKRIRKNKDILCIYTKDKVAILFANNGFTKGDKEQLYSLIETAKIKKCNWYFTKNN